VLTLYISLSVQKFDVVSCSSNSFGASNAKVSGFKQFVYIYQKFLDIKGRVGSFREASNSKLALKALDPTLHSEHLQSHASFKTCEHAQPEQSQS